MALTLVSGPQEEPVSLPEAKLFLRQDGSDDDRLIESFISAARQHIDGRDGWLGRALVTQSWDLTLDGFPMYPWTSSVYFESQFGPGLGPIITVPLAPLISVTSITYTDTNGTPQTLAGTEYSVDAKSQPGRIVPAPGKVWPIARYGILNAVTVRFVAGYGAADDVPEGIRFAIKALVAHWYENRAAVDVGAGVEVPMHVEALLAPYRLWGLCYA